MKKIYIVTTFTGTLLSCLIRNISKTPYAHVSIALNEYLRPMYSFGRLDPDNPFSGGLTTENIYTGVFQKSPNARCLIYKLEITEKQFLDLEREIKSFFDSDINYRYNFIGLFGVLMDKPIHRDNHYFCSQFITTLLKQSNIWHSPKIPELTSPTDLLNIPNKTLIYEGFINELDFSIETQVALI